MSNGIAPDRHVQLLSSFGLGIWSLTYACRELGWTTPRGGFPYFHVDSPALDLVRWTTGDQEAKGRLYASLPDWEPFIKANLEHQFRPAVKA